MAVWKNTLIKDNILLQLTIEMVSTFSTVLGLSLFVYLIYIFLRKALE